MTTSRSEPMPLPTPEEFDDMLDELADAASSAMSDYERGISTLGNDLRINEAKVALRKAFAARRVAAAPERSGEEIEAKLAEIESRWIASGDGPDDDDCVWLISQLRTARRTAPADSAEPGRVRTRVGAAVHNSWVDGYAVGRASLVSVREEAKALLAKVERGTVGWHYAFHAVVSLLDRALTGEKP